MNLKIGRKLPWHNLRYCLGICLEQLRRTRGTLSGYSVSLMQFELDVSRTGVRTVVAWANLLSPDFLLVSQVCIQALGHTECISPLKQAMQARRDMIGVVCEALNRLFSTNHDQLISQVGHTTFAMCFSPIYYDNMGDPHCKFIPFFFSFLSLFLFSFHTLIFLSSVFSQVEDETVRINVHSWVFPSLLRFRMYSQFPSSGSKWLGWVNVHGFKGSWGERWRLI
jgi:hypothetical protein